MIVAATSADVATSFIEIGAVALVLAVLARIAGRFGFTPIPLYLVAGLAVGEGGVLPLDVSHDFIELVAEIGVLLLLLTLGLEYSTIELRHGLRTGAAAGLVDAIANFVPGFVAGIALGWELPASVLLGGVCWVSSSGIVSKVLADLDRLGNRETPAILNLLVIEDLAMAVFLPIASALVLGRSFGSTVGTIAIALAAVSVIMLLAFRAGDRLSAVLDRGGDEPLLLAVFGLTLVVGGLAQRLEVSAAIGAFLVGLALSGPVQHRAGALIGPLRDLFAAVFFIFFSFQIEPARLVDALIPAALLAIAGITTKIGTGWFAAAQAGVGRAGRIRAGTTLAARGEFSIVIASLGAGLADGDQLGAIAAGFVLLTAVVGPLATRSADRLAAATARGRVTVVLASTASEFADVTVPWWAWIALVAGLTTLLVVDLLLVHRTAHVVTTTEAAIESAVWISLGLLFGVVIGVWLGGQAAGEYYAGFLIEKSLSIDNVFVWAVIFSFFAVPRAYQFRVLFWGVFGALVLRAVFIVAGVSLIERFGWVLYVFGAFLLYTAWKIARHNESEQVDYNRNVAMRVVRRVVPTTDRYDGQKLFTHENGKRVATPLFAVLVLIEVTDVVFAVDSVPAILAVSRETFIVFAANAFAILGLRALYFLLGGMQDRFRYLNVGLGVILAFVGAKMILAGDPFDVHMPTAVSLGVIAAVLAVAVGASVRAERD